MSKQNENQASRVERREGKAPENEEPIPEKYMNQVQKMIDQAVKAASENRSKSKLSQPKHSKNPFNRITEDTFPFPCQEVNVPKTHSLTKPTKCCKIIQ